MERVQRRDVGKLDKFERTPSGGLRIPAFLSRIGIQEYRDEQGTVIREFRPPAEVLSAESVASFEDAPVTDLHPDGGVTPVNWREVSVGQVKGAHADGDKVAATLLILDAAEIRRIEAGERVEVSAGYSCELDASPGYHDGQPYEFVQRNIRVNHVGIGPEGWGRAGPEVSLRLDGATENDMTTKRMVRVDGIEYEAGSESHLQAVERLLQKRDGEIAERTRERDEARTETKARVAALEAERDKERGRADALTGERDELKKKLDTATSVEELDARVAARVALVDRARRWLGKEYKHAGKSDRAIMADAIKKAAGKKIADESSDAYVQGLFDGMPDPEEEEEEEEHEDGQDREDADDVEVEGGRVKVKTDKNAKPKLSGLDKVRADNAEWLSKANERFAARKS